jgi:S1-C subfamily serine protease
MTPAARLAAVLALKVDPRRSVVKIAVFGAGATDLGSGTVIASANGKSLILTNAHVVESGEYPIEVYHKDASGKAWTHKAKYVGGSQVIHTGPGKIEVNGPDLALLEIDDELPAVEIATDKPTYGSTVRQFGFGGMGGYTQFWPKKGQIVESNYVERELASFQSIPGDSGSGWFNDAGQLVAVCCSTPGAGSGEALAVPVYQVQGFVVQSAGNRLPLFPRLAALKQRMQARRAAPVELAPQAPQSTAPKAQAAPPVFATPCPTCPNGRCPTQPAFGGYYVFPGRR